MPSQANTTGLSDNAALVLIREDRCPMCLGKLDSEWRCIECGYNAAMLAKLLLSQPVPSGAQVHCFRCGIDWTPTPKECPNCHRRDWASPTVRPVGRPRNKKEDKRENVEESGKAVDALPVCEAGVPGTEARLSSAIPEPVLQPSRNEPSADSGEDKPSDPEAGPHSSEEGVDRRVIPVIRRKP